MIHLVEALVASAPYGSCGPMEIAIEVSTEIDTKISSEVSSEIATDITAPRRPDDRRRLHEKKHGSERRRPGEVRHPLPAPTDEEIAQILEHFHGRVIALLRRRGRLPEEPSATDPLAAQMPLLASYTAASIQELIATGPRAGHPVRRLRTAAAVVDGEKLRCARLNWAATCCARRWPWTD